MLPQYHRGTCRCAHARPVGAEKNPIRNSVRTRAMPGTIRCSDLDRRQADEVVDAERREEAQAQKRRAHVVAVDGEVGEPGEVLDDLVQDRDVEVRPHEQERPAPEQDAERPLAAAPQRPEGEHEERRARVAARARPDLVDRWGRSCRGCRRRRRARPAGRGRPSGS